MRLLRFIFPYKDRSLFSIDPTLLDKAIQSYGLSPADLIPVRYLGSYVFRNSDTSYLKLTEKSIMSFDTIRQINLWQKYLSDQNAPVATIMPSVNGHLEEKIPFKETYFTAVLYKKITGNAVTRPDWNTGVFRQIGELTGKLHKLSKNYPVKKNTDQIPEWPKNIIKPVIEHIPSRNKALSDRFLSLCNLTKNYSRSNDNYGIIHNDIDRGNMKIDGNKIYLFDFDDTHFSWYINDIANVFFHALIVEKKTFEESLDYFNTFKSNFWEAYNRENQLPAEELKSIPLWIAIRAIFTYSYLCRIGDAMNFEPTHRANFLLIKKYALHKFEEMDPKIFY